MTSPSTLWVLNFDAEIELDRAATWLAAGRPPDAFSYAPTKGVQASVDRNVQRFAAELDAGAFVLAGDEGAAHEFRGSAGLCWCPTPSALARLRRGAARVGDAPSLEVLAQVNHRRFCAELGQTLSAAQFVTTLDEMNRLLATSSPTGEWLCKRPFSFAGRGQRRIAAESPTRSHLSPDNQRWLQESVPHGGLQIEPCVPLIAEFSVHGLVRRNAPATLGQVCQQYVDEHAAWSHATATPSYPLTGDERQRLIAETERAAAALASAQYFGPFSVDSYLWRDRSGAPQLNPRSEINARLTMGYPVGMGAGWVEDLIVACGTV